MLPWLSTAADPGRVHTEGRAARGAGEHARGQGAARLGADLLSVGAHKFGVREGGGALLVRRGLRLRPLLVGAEQERARRAGMENLAAIAGFGAAAETVALDDETAAARSQTARALQAALAVDGVVAYGDKNERLPHIVCVGVEGVEAEALLLGLDQAGVGSHSGSPISSG